MNHTGLLILRKYKIYFLIDVTEVILMKLGGNYQYKCMAQFETNQEFSICNFSFTFSFIQEMFIFLSNFSLQKSIKYRRSLLLV